MVKPSERRKKKKFTRTPGAKTKRSSIKKRSSKKTCALCKRKLSGTAHGRKDRGIAKTKKRPSVKFGGKLCNVCRARVFEEAIKIKITGKKLEETELRIRPFIEEASRKIEG